MASLSYQTWSAGQFNWVDSASTGAGYQVYTAFADWATAVNLNAGMAGRQIVEIYGPSQATTPGTNIGFMFNMKKSDGTDFYFQHYTSGTTPVWMQGDVHTPGTANGGYGTLTAPTSPDLGTPSVWSYVTTNQSTATDVWVATSTVDGEEFIVMAASDGTSSTTYNFTFIGKDLNNEWLAYTYQTSTIWTGNGILADGKLVIEVGSNSVTNAHPFIDNGFVQSPFLVNVANYTVQTGPVYQKIFGLASPDIGSCNTTTYAPGNYIDLGNGDVWCNLGGAYAPWIKFTPTV